MSLNIILLVCAFIVVDAHPLSVISSSSSSSSSSASLYLSQYSLVPVTSPSVYFTEWNWYLGRETDAAHFGAQLKQTKREVTALNKEAAAAGQQSEPLETFVGDVATTTAPGAYFKISFTGTVFGFKLLVKPSSNYNDILTIRYRLDSLAPIDVRFPSAVSNSDHVYVDDSTLSSGDSSEHTAQVWLYNSDDLYDRWNHPDSAVRVTHIILQKGASTERPPLRPNRMLVYWDSIGEGYSANGLTGSKLDDNSCFGAFPVSLAETMNAEVSVVAYAAQGYLQGGGGYVPELINPASPERSSWHSYYKGHSRLNKDGVFEHGQPDYIFVGLGTNDAINTPDIYNEVRMAEYVIAFIEAIRKASPNSILFVCIPFGQYAAAPIKDAFKIYQSRAEDQHVILIDLGVKAAIGLDDKHKKPEYSPDGGHPYTARALELGKLLGEAALAALR